MTDHPITPPPELKRQWREQAPPFRDYSGVGRELWLIDRAARRPKPPSLKEQALEDLESLIADLANHGMGFKATNIIRALGALNDD